MEMKKGKKKKNGREKDKRMKPNGTFPKPKGSS